MRWYVRASKPITVPEGLEGEISSLAKEISRKSREINETWGNLRSFHVFRFRNPYTGKDETVEVLVGPRRLAHGKGEAKFDSPYIYIWPTTTADWLFLASTIRHELAHAVDPKLSLPQYQARDMMFSEYFQSPEEFDAWTSQFSADLVADIRNMATESPEMARKVLNGIRDWLRSGLSLKKVRFLLLPESWRNDLYDMVYFIKEKAKKTGDDSLMRRLMQRTYWALEQAEIALSVSDARAWHAPE